jgi:transketolase
MRRDFAKMLLAEMREDKGKNIVLLTADMGYGLWDDVRKEFPERFFNFGSSEQLMIGAAAGMAMEGKVPVCYSITPFLLFRPFEFIRNLMNHEGIPIKLAGGGRDKDYGYLGFTHWAEDDIDIMLALPHIELHKPDTVEELKEVFNVFLYNPQPAYINLSK